jgi:hypothetical protein
LKYGKFLKKVAAIAHLLTLDGAIQTIIDTDKKPVFLCVDEVVKSGFPMEVASAIGNCLSELDSSQFNAVISTLDWNPIKTATRTQSQRDLKSIVLKALSDSSSHALLGKFDNNLAVQRSIAFCNGHPASLANLAIYLQQHPDPETTIDIVKGMKNMKKISPTTEHVKLALAGDSVQLSWQDSNHITFSDLITNGIFLNSIADTSEEAIPLLSPLRLFFWADKEPQFNEDGLPIMDAETNASAAVKELLLKYVYCILFLNFAVQMLPQVAHLKYFMPIGKLHTEPYFQVFLPIFRKRFFFQRAKKLNASNTLSPVLLKR